MYRHIQDSIKITWKENRSKSVIKYENDQEILYEYDSLGTLLKRSIIPVRKTKIRNPIKSKKIFVSVLRRVEFPGGFHSLENTIKKYVGDKKIKKKYRGDKTLVFRINKDGNTKVSWLHRDEWSQTDRTKELIKVLNNIKWSPMEIGSKKLNCKIHLPIRLIK